MFILTDGKNYVGENPMKAGDYIRVTSPIMATELTFKQARALKRNKNKKLSWIKCYEIINLENGQVEKDVKRYSNEGVFLDDKKYEFDNSVLIKIQKEVDSIIGLAGWDITQLNTYKAILNQGQSYYDSALSDVRHVRMGKRPPAHMMVKIDQLMNELEEKRRDVKQTIVYIETLISGIEKQWSVPKLKSELAKAKYTPYKGRTKYYNMVEDLLNRYQYQEKSE